MPSRRSSDRNPRGPGLREIDGGRAAARLSELRAAETDEGGDRLFLATLRLRIPTGIWTGPFSQRHPGTRLEALNRTDVTPSVSVSDYWMSGRPPGLWAAEIQEFEDVLKVDSLAEVGDGCLYRIKYRNPPVVGLYRRLRLPLQFPLRIQGGFITWEIAARYGEARAILEHARRADPMVQVISVRRRPLRSHLPVLTESQQTLLTKAMAAGYFAVPRGITLTALARKLDRSKSAISEGIALIEKKLVESAMHAGSMVP